MSRPSRPCSIGRRDRQEHSKLSGQRYVEPLINGIAYSRITGGQMGRLRSHRSFAHHMHTGEDPEERSMTWVMPISGMLIPDPGVLTLVPLEARLSNTVPQGGVEAQLSSFCILGIASSYRTARGSLWRPNF
jgi:hypothetical protein